MSRDAARDANKVGGEVMLTITALEHFYGESHTLWDLDLDVAAGARACLMGRNGVGKTTLLKCIMGLELSLIHI